MMEPKRKPKEETVNLFLFSAYCYIVLKIDQKRTKTKPLKATTPSITLKISTLVALYSYYSFNGFSCVVLSDISTVNEIELQPQPSTNHTILYINPFENQISTIYILT